MTIDIGDFARMGQVSVRMLRHYHDNGLLIPAEVDPHSGRRAYHRDQLERLQQIVLMRDLGFGVAQIADLLAEPPQGWRRRLTERHRHVVLDILESTHQSDRIQALLRILADAPGRTAQRGVVTRVQVRTVPALPVVGLRRGVTGGAGFAATVEAQFDEAGRAMDSAGASRQWPISRSSPGPDGTDGTDRIDLLTGFVCNSTPARLERVELAVVQVASVIHEGPMDQVGAAHQALQDWALAEGGLTPELLARSPRRIIFFTTDQFDSTNWTVDVQLELPAT